MYTVNDFVKNIINDIKNDYEIKYGKNRVKFYLHYWIRRVKLFMNKRKIINRFNVNGYNNNMNFIPKGLELSIYGNNNTIDIDKTVPYFNGRIQIGDKDHYCNNCVIKIGPNSAAGKLEIVIFEHNSQVIIGKDFMCSFDVKIWCTDSHSIYDINSKKLLNKGKSIIIEDHVWVCMNSTILKNSLIKANTIIGAHSVVAKKFNENNVIIAGNPAKIIKRNINWDRARPEDFQA